MLPLAEIAVSPPRAEKVLVLPSKIAVDWEVGDVERRPLARLKAMTGPLTGAKYTVLLK